MIVWGSAACRRRNPAIRVWGKLVEFRLSQKPEKARSIFDRLCRQKFFSARACQLTLARVGLHPKSWEPSEAGPNFPYVKTERESVRLLQVY